MLEISRMTLSRKVIVVKKNNDKITIDGAQNLILKGSGILEIIYNDRQMKSRLFNYAEIAYVIEGETTTLINNEKELKENGKN